MITIIIIISLPSDAWKNNNNQVNLVPTTT
jgi:hypothetical protein